MTTFSDFYQIFGCMNGQEIIAELELKCNDRNAVQ